MDDEWQLRMVRVPKGTHLSESRETEGAERDLLREDGTNKLLGPTESIPADDSYELRRHDADDPTDSGSQGRSAGAPFIEQVISEVVAQIPWDEVFEKLVVPAFRRARGRLGHRFASARPKSDGDPGTAVEVAALEPPEAAGVSLDTTADAIEIRMSAEEFRDRVMSVFAAESYAARQREVLSNARIDEGDLDPGLQRAVVSLLSGNAASLGRSEVEAAMRFLQSSPIGGRAHEVPNGREIKVLPPLLGEGSG